MYARSLARSFTQEAKFSMMVISEKKIKTFLSKTNFNILEMKFFISISLLLLFS
jgi:hypothetical protein